MSTGDLVDLTVDLCGVRLASPLLLGSGGLGESAASLRRYQDTCAAVVTRTVRTQIRPERRVFPSPHLALDRRRRWLLNCEWGNLRPLSYWHDQALPQLVPRGPVIVSVSGRDTEDCAQTIHTLSGSGVAMVEINFSCSHAGVLDGRLTDDAAHVAATVRAAKQQAEVPVIAKLGWSTALVPVADAAARAGADAIAVTNSIGPGLDIDLATLTPRLGMQGGYGGVSGPALFPIALRCVQEVTEAVRIPVIGVGGVGSAEDVLKMILVGATAVQIYTAALLHGPILFGRIAADLARYLTVNRVPTLAELRGRAWAGLRAPARLTKRVPLVDTSRCHPCGKCVTVCTPGAIDLREVATIDADTCTGCGICVDVCPPGFNALSLS
jgi:dihydroorotate dehydrogenase (NAD+) catalytic subunit